MTWRDRQYKKVHDVEERLRAYAKLIEADMAPEDLPDKMRSMASDLSDALHHFGWQGQEDRMGR